MILDASKLDKSIEWIKKKLWKKFIRRSILSSYAYSPLSNKLTFPNLVHFVPSMALQAPYSAVGCHGRPSNQLLVPTHLQSSLISWSRSMGDWYGKVTYQVWCDLSNTPCAHDTLLLLSVSLRNYIYWLKLSCYLNAYSRKTEGTKLHVATQKS